MPKYDEQLELVKAKQQKFKKEARVLDLSIKKEPVDRKRAKEIERFLLPDAPPRKHSRKESPERGPCRLTPGTPTVTPAPKLQPWERQEPEHRAMAQQNKDDRGQATPPPAAPQEPGSSHSTTSFDSLVEVAGFSPLQVNWTTGNLKTKSSSSRRSAPPRPAKTKKTRVSESKPPTAAAAPAAASSCPVVRESGQLSGKGADILEELLDTLSSDDENIIDEESIVAPLLDGDFTTFQPAEPTLTQPEQIEWLERDDMISDRLLQDMLPVDDDNLTFDWTHDPNAFKGQRHDFIGKSGPTFEINDNTKPIDIFSKFFNDDFLDMIVRQTNKQADFIIDRGVTTPTSRLNSWKNIDRDEICIFFAILILQGMAPLSVERHYWKENGWLTMTRFRKLMTYNRFLLIKRLLHFTNDRTTTTDRLRKIRPVLDHLSEKFSTLYLPGRDIAIDESLLKWQGRLTFAQKIANKAAKVGVKSYELCESSTGYLWKFFIYAGKGTETDQTDTTLTGQTDTDQTAPPPPTNATAQIVHDLIKPLLNLGHTLTMDNFYNSPLLARYLKANGTDCFGTVRVNREFVPDFIKSVPKGEMRVGEIVQSFCRDLSIMLWRDTNMVAMLSTFHKGEVGGKEKNGRYKFKPQVVLDYNLSMGGVDKKDQLLAAYPMERSRNQVWYKKVFRRLLNVTLLNAYIIYKTHNTTSKQRDFRNCLVNELIDRSRPVAIESAVVETRSLMVQSNFKRPIVTGNHFAGAGPTKHSRCRWCHKGRTKYICKLCDVPLCILPCFEEFHTAKDRPSRCLPSQ